MRGPSQTAICCIIFLNILILVKKHAKSKTKKKKSKTTSGANQKTKLEHVAEEPTEPSDEKQLVDEKFKSDIKQDDHQHEANSKSHNDVSESFNLQFDRCRAERYEDNASVAAESSVGGKGYFSLAASS